MTTFEQFETLMALLLADEISSEKEQILHQIIDSSEIYRKRYQKYIETKSFLINLSEKSFEEISLLEISPATKKKNWLYVSLAAAAIFAVLIIQLFWNRQQDELLLEVYATRLDEKCTEGNDQKLSPGVKIKDTRITSGSSSFCDMQVEKFKNLAMRIGQETKLDFKHEKEKIVINLLQGQLFLDEISKKSNSSTLIIVGKIRIHLIGTKVVVLSGSDESLQVDVIDGEVLLEQMDKQMKLSLRTGESWTSGKGNTEVKTISSLNLDNHKKQFARMRYVPREYLDSPEKIRKFYEEQEQKTKLGKEKSEPGQTSEEIIKLIFKIIKKDGSSIVGKVTETSDEYILKNKDGIFKIPKSEVEKIESE